MTQRKLHLLSLLMTISIIHANVFIRGPKELIKKLPNEGILPASISNFGRIPYGYNVMGIIKYDISSLGQVEACEDLPPIQLTHKQVIDESPIVMVDRGTCTFTRKVQNIENAGGHIAMIVNNEDSDPVHIIMSDDGHGKTITIPAVLISQSDGNIIKDFMRSNPDKDIVVEIDFEMVSIAFDFTLYNLTL